MAHKIGDRIKEMASTSGVGAFTLAGAVANFSPFSAMPGGWLAGDTTWYCAINSSEWEIGLGTRGASASTLTRSATPLSSSNGGALVNFTAPPVVFCTVPAALHVGAREVLTAARTYYVRTDGNDANDGLSNTAAGAFLTIQKAIDTISGKLDMAGFAVTVQLADGTYTAGAVAKPFTGGNEVIIQGNAATPANVHVSPNGNAFTCDVPGMKLRVQNMKVSGGAGHALLTRNTGQIDYSNIEFGASNFHTACTDNGVIKAIGNYSISGAANCHHYAEGGRISVSGRTVTHLAALNYATAFARCSFLAGMFLTGNTYAGSAATGKRYELSLNGVINAGGAPGYFPGNSDGTIASGGQYA